MFVCRNYPLAACRTWGADFTIASSESTRCRSFCSGTAAFSGRRTCGTGCRKRPCALRGRGWSGFRQVPGERARTGSAQYHPRTMLALLIYCYANGIFGRGGSSARPTPGTWRRTATRITDLHVSAQHFGASRRRSWRCCCWRRNEAAASRDAARRWTRTRTSATASATTVRGSCASSCGLSKGLLDRAERGRGRRVGAAGSAGGVEAPGDAEGEAGQGLCGAGASGEGA